MSFAVSAGTQGAFIALLAAILWGGGDFSGGMGVKAAGGSIRSALRIIVAGHGMSLVVLLGGLWWTHAVWPSAIPLLWGSGAGLAGALGLIVFYVALAEGAMGAAAAISGLLAAAIPAAVSGILEGAPGPLRLLGFLLAALAIWLIATPPTEPTSIGAGMNRRTAFLAIGGGIGFGVYFVALRFANRAGILEPMAMARVASLTLCSLLLLFRRKGPEDLSGGDVAKSWLPRKAWLWAAGVAVLDTGGNLLFIQSTRMGRLDAAAVLASLYPASTILLAALVLHERPARQQVLGMGLALVAVALVAR